MRVIYRHITLSNPMFRISLLVMLTTLVIMWNVVLVGILMVFPSSMKLTRSLVSRYVNQQQSRDVHPLIYDILQGRDDVMKMGIDKYNAECRAIVMRYSSEWRKTVERMARWIDFDNDYKTLNPTFMESVWWVFKQLYDKGQVYRGQKVMPYSTACHTPLSNFESSQNYKDVNDPAGMLFCVSLSL